jgi:hypothetical protein
VCAERYFTWLVLDRGPVRAHSIPGGVFVTTLIAIIFFNLFDLSLSHIHIEMCLNSQGTVGHQNG